MRNGRIRNHKITASSSYNRFHAAWLGRLGRVKTGRYIGAWCAKYKNYHQWFKVDFGRPMKITKIASQGRQDVGHWVTSYYVSFSADNIHWAMYRFRSVNKVRRIRKHNNWICWATRQTGELVLRNKGYKRDLLRWSRRRNRDVKKNVLRY